jgi:predicted naringenin-chalcone synthase
MIRILIKGQYMPRYSKIIAVETSVPVFHLTQDEIFDVIDSHQKLSDRERLLYQRFLSDRSILKRHIACDDVSQIFNQTSDELHARYRHFAVKLGSDVLRKALISGGIDPAQLDGLIVTSCTGYLCPGLTSYISESLGLRDDILAYDLIGHGCGAAIPALSLAQLICSKDSSLTVAVVSVEICTAAIHWGESVDLVLSNAIFADGASAVIVSSEAERDGVALKRCHRILWPEYRDELQFIHQSSRLCNVLGKRVPEIVGRGVTHLYQKIVSDAIHPERIIVHTGGRKILDAIEMSLSLKPHQLELSRCVLRDYGNMSSPSVMFVLRRLLTDQPLAAGEEVLMLTFGAGFSAYAAMCEWIPAGSTTERSSYEQVQCCY